MTDPLPSSTEKPAVVVGSSLKKLWFLTITSLTLNGLILVLLVAGAILHHHHRPPGFGGPGGGRFGEEGPMGCGPHFHQFGGPGGGPPGGGEQGPGGPGGPPPGMPGMMGGKKNGPPDPARMSEDILNHLSTQLSLTDDEKTKIKPIVEAQVAEIQKQMEAQRLAMQKQFEDTKAKIKPLLTADQQKQLDAMPLPGPKPPAPNGGQPPQPPDPMPGQ